MYFKIFLLVFIFAATFFSCDSMDSYSECYDTSMAYHFDEPASIWEETFPLGNGRIGMMPV
jgi:hypothetical protein